MTTDDKPKFFELMYALAECFSGELTEFGLELRFRALTEFKIEQLESACLHLLKTRKYTKMPTVAEILEGIHGDTDDWAAIEAVQVLKAIKQIGGGQSVTFGDLVTMSVIKNSFGGWVQLCTTLKGDDEKWFLKDFAKAYRVHSRSGMKETEHLPGIVETENGSRGYITHIPAPISIEGLTGNREIEHQNHLAGRVQDEREAG